MGASLYRILIGYLLGASIGIVIGLVLGFSRWAEAMGSPILYSLYPIKNVDPILIKAAAKTISWANANHLYYAIFVPISTIQYHGYATRNCSTGFFKRFLKYIHRAVLKMLSRLPSIC